MWHPDMPLEYRNQIVTGDARESAHHIPELCSERRSLTLKGVLLFQLFPNPKIYVEKFVEFAPIKGIDK